MSKSLAKFAGTFATVRRSRATRTREIFRRKLFLTIRLRIAASTNAAPHGTDVGALLTSAVDLT
jgi:hypothetical protein